MSSSLDDERAASLLRGAALLLCQAMQPHDAAAMQFAAVQRPAPSFCRSMECELHVVCV